jgi:FXSXX-COOH protein
MSRAIDRTDEVRQSADLGTAPLADLRGERDTALAAAIARVSDEAAEPGAVAAAFQSAT